MIAKREKTTGSAQLGSLPVIVIAIAAVVGVLWYSFSDPAPSREHGNVSQTKNPTNAPGTTKQP